ncbi:MAG: hypothetical protein C4523_14890 [Myxococcales bacterium]|nr:MAG: hypothetical protein C4523_14890 [Myxococcales bacterium]
MEGITYLVDEKGNKRAVVLDLAKHGALWEDVLDNLVAETRKKEARQDWETVKRPKAKSRRS